MCQRSTTAQACAAAMALSGSIWFHRRYDTSIPCDALQVVDCEIRDADEAELRDALAIAREDARNFGSGGPPSRVSGRGLRLVRTTPGGSPDHCAQASADLTDATARNPYAGRCLSSSRQL
jgi:hypothetical protein